MKMSSSISIDEQSSKKLRTIDNTNNSRITTNNVSDNSIVIKPSDANSTPHHHQHTTVVAATNNGGSRIIIPPCNKCILCRMPNCDQCYVCSMASNDSDNDNHDTNNNMMEVEQGQGDEGDQKSKKKSVRECCVRKACCNIPTEFKLQTLPQQEATKLGWIFNYSFSYTFDNPQKLPLVYNTQRILSLAGLKIFISPSNDKKKTCKKVDRGEGEGAEKQRAVHHSLDSAFGSIVNAIITSSGSKDTNGQEATDDSNDNIIAKATHVISNFLTHVGSTGYLSIPDHFLIGKHYCIEFTTRTINNIGSSKVVLFGQIMACMKSSLSNDGVNNATGECFFIVQYDKDVLSHVNKQLQVATQLSSSNDINIPLIQLISSKQAWGGCISYERLSYLRRDSYSVIQNIDQATSLETWIVPDVQYEEMMLSDDKGEGGSGSGSGGQQKLLPQLTIFVRGYKFTFRVKPHGGVYVSCTTMKTSSPQQEVNLKPGELIDLGIFAPLDIENDAKPLPAYLVKNYIHQFKSSQYAVVAGNDNIVYDITDDDTGELHDVARKHVLSYVRHCKKKDNNYPTLHTRLDPRGYVHLLFGVPYQGNWVDYEHGMSHLVPILMGTEVEVYHSQRNSSISIHQRKKDTTNEEEKYIQSISLFQLDDITACNKQLTDMIFNSSNEEGVDVHHKTTTYITRAKKVIKCLEDRTRMLLDMFTDAKTQDDAIGGGCINSNVITSQFPTILSALGQLQKLNQELDRQSKIDP